MSKNNASKKNSKARLSPSRIAVMKAASKGGSIHQIAKATRLDPHAAYHHVWCARRDGHVRSTELDIDGKTETRFELTAAGRKALASA